MGESVLLKSCYLECLRLAVDNGCESVAFPLISSGLNGYPKDRVLKDAVAVIGNFLDEYEILVYLVIYDKSAYSVSPALLEEIRGFILVELESEPTEEMPFAFDEELTLARVIGRRRQRGEKLSAAQPAVFSAKAASLDDMLKQMDRGFAETLFSYIDKREITDVEAYKRSNVDKKTFSKIKCNKNYRPSKITAVSFAIGLHLSLEETRHLLSTAGMCLSRSSVFDVIIEYFVTTGNYETIFDVNEVLYQFDQALLGV